MFSNVTIQAAQKLSESHLDVVFEVPEYKKTPPMSVYSLAHQIGT